MQNPLPLIQYTFKCLLYNTANRFSYVVNYLYFTAKSAAHIFRLYYYYQLTSTVNKLYIYFVLIKLKSALYFLDLCLNICYYVLTNKQLKQYRTKIMCILRSQIVLKSRRHTCVYQGFYTNIRSES